MKYIPNYPAYLDFKSPRLGHAFNINKEIGKFGDKFKALDATVFYDPTIERIDVGDVILSKLPKDIVGMFRVINITPDLEVENTIYCQVIVCGYHIEKPLYFKGFLDTWDKYYPSKPLVDKTIVPVMKTEVSKIYSSTLLWDILTTVAIICGIGVLVFGCALLTYLATK